VVATGPNIGVIQNFNNYHIEFKNVGKESLNSVNNTTTNDLSNEDLQSIERILAHNNSNTKQQINNQMNSTRQTINNINQQLLDAS
jgi:predicted transcriptional regulator